MSMQKIQRPKVLLLGVVLAGLSVIGCSKSPMPPPVTVTVRDSLVGIGKVVRIYNYSSHHLYNVKVVARNFAEGSSASVRATSHLEPYDTVEVGWMEFGAWVPQSGESIQVYCDDHLTPRAGIIP